MDSPVLMGAGSLSSSTEPDHPVPVKKFYQGEPLALGISQIFIGITGIAFGNVLNKIHDDGIYVNYWGGILVKGMLAMNAISAIAAGLGIVLPFFIVGPTLQLNFARICNYDGYDTKEKCDEIQNIARGIMVILTVFTVLEFCIAISIASFGCKMLCRDPFAETVVVIYQNVTPANAEEHPPFDCKQPVIHP
ncbi:membrane-spanning 4-domains subfamily A member 4A-like isoform 2-T2 [Vipera latastei]